jgi:hypothetical protein
MRIRLSLTAHLFILLSVFAASAACTSAAILQPHFQTTLLHPDLYPPERRADGNQGKSGLIYRVSEEQAFTTALEAYATLLPKQSLDDIVEGKWRGYNADLWIWADHWSNRILVIPVIGNAGGADVRGYYYTYSGSGTILPLRERSPHYILGFIRKRLDATGRGVIVDNIRDGEYETDGRAYLGLKRDGREVWPLRPAAQGTAADRMAELKRLRDKSLITEEEFQAQRRRILDGL